jgi:hypothetical protein
MSPSGIEEKVRVEMRARQQISALIAVSAVAAGVMATATAAEAAVAPRSSAACTNAAGKYHGTVVGSHALIGYDSQGRPMEEGGTMKVWHSAACGTLWVRAVKRAKYMDVARDTGILIEFYNTDLQRDDYLSSSAMTQGALETPAVPVGAHGSAQVGASFVGDYQYTADQTVTF